jgi:hypothetical protein
MRKALLFIVASAMIVGGLSLLFADLYWATRIYSLAVFGGGGLVTVGGYLLWEDFIAPVHKQTFALRNAMSALPPKADIHVSDHYPPAPGIKHLICVLPS